MTGADAVIVKQLEPRPAAGIVIPGIPRHAVDAAFHGALPDVFSHLQAHGVEMAGPPFARFDDHAGGGTFDVEIGIPIAASAACPETDTIKVRSLPGGDAATAIADGDADQAWQAIDAWKAVNHRRSSGPRWQNYLDQARTELVDPLA